MLLPGQRLQILDTITGEIVTETSNPDAGVYLGKKKKHPGGFIVVYESEFREAALILKDYGTIPLCLWNVLMTKVEIGTGEILVNTVELAEMLKSHQPNMSKGIKLLAELGFIVHVRKDGKHHVYKINPTIMWKGREKERQDMLKLLQGGKS
jgi:hypothetical protein